MNCPVDDGLMREVATTQEDEYRGVPLRFSAPGMRCDSCSYETVTVAQAAEYNRAMVDAYRSHEGLLTSDDIRAARQRLDMSQQDFADYLGVGIASVKRWEWGQVQEKSLDKLIRVLTDPAEAERVAQRVRKLVAGPAVKGAACRWTARSGFVGVNWADFLTSTVESPIDWSLQHVWSTLLPRSVASHPPWIVEPVQAKRAVAVEADGSAQAATKADEARRALRLVS